ncbi:MAG TPA: hypothetical protein VFE34_16430 [Dongiaceae bacterium]|jgi:hypothetical protein|nr:hypothetical protein [Dongiaceae bacterium]
MRTVRLIVAALVLLGLGIAAGMYLIGGRDAFERLAADHPPGTGLAPLAEAAQTRPPPTAATSSPAPVSGANTKILFYRNPMGTAEISPVPRKDSMGMDFIPVYDTPTGAAPAAGETSPTMQRGWSPLGYLAPAAMLLGLGTDVLYRPGGYGSRRLWRPAVHFQCRKKEEGLMIQPSLNVPCWLVVASGVCRT